MVWHAALAECCHVFINVQSHNPVVKEAFLVTGIKFARWFRGFWTKLICQSLYVYIIQYSLSIPVNYIWMILPRFYVWAHWWSCLLKCMISPRWCWMSSSPSILQAFYAKSRTFNRSVQTLCREYKLHGAAKAVILILSSDSKLHPNCITFATAFSLKQISKFTLHLDIANVQKLQPIWVSLCCSTRTSNF